MDAAYDAQPDCGSLVGQLSEAIDLWFRPHSVRHRNSPLPRQGVTKIAVTTYIRWIYDDFASDKLPLSCGRCRLRGVTSDRAHAILEVMRGGTLTHI